jgi:hypothetical protein
MRPRRHAAPLLSGAIAGTAGTIARLAMRAFDARYAPLTVVAARSGAGAASAWPQIGGDVLGGAAYGILSRRSTSALVGGVALGASVYAAEALVVVPAVGAEPPVWRQSWPQIAGSLLRHVAYGVVTAAIVSAVRPTRRS